MKKFTAVLIALYINIKIVESFGNSGVQHERKLINFLLKNYDKNIRPTYSLEIKFSLHLNQIITLLEQEQTIVLNAFLDHEWIDPRLSWNPKNHGNITLLRINSELLWA